MSKRIIAALILLLLLILSPFVIFTSLSMQPLYSVYSQKTQEMKHNKAGYEYLFSTVFDKATQCLSSDQACRESVQREIMSTLQTENLNFPVYYLRLTPSGTLQKLFLSGEVTEIFPQTSGEKRVVSLLTGSAHNLLWNTRRIDFSNLSAVYLNDLYAEAEVIVPFKKNFKVLGALVYLYGD